MSKIMDADLADAGVTVSCSARRRDRHRHAALTPGPRASGPRPCRDGLPIVWLASDEATGVHDERTIATEFELWLCEWVTSAGSRAEATANCVLSAQGGDCAELEQAIEQVEAWQDDLAVILPPFQLAKCHVMVRQ
jgi:hypothetical protein